MVVLGQPNMQSQGGGVFFNISWCGQGKVAYKVSNDVDKTPVTRLEPQEPEQWMALTVSTCEYNKGHYSSLPKSAHHIEAPDVGRLHTRLRIGW